MQILGEPKIPEPDMSATGRSEAIARLRLKGV